MRCFRPQTGSPGRVLRPGRLVLEATSLFNALLQQSTFEGPRPRGRQFFQTPGYKVRAPPGARRAVRLLPGPRPGRPAGFSGLVGSSGRPLPYSRPYYNRALLDLAQGTPYRGPKPGVRNKFLPPRGEGGLGRREGWEDFMGGGGVVKIPHD